MDDVARSIADDLHLDMPRARHALLDVHVADAEGSARFGLAAGVGFVDLVRPLHDPHPATAAARHRLYHYRAAATE